MRAELPFTTRYSILLDQRHHITTLIVCEAHHRVKHDGVKETLTEVLDHLWEELREEVIASVCFVVTKEDLTSLHLYHHFLQ